jgi:NADP-dependent aldehyde dehydrogenase
VPQTTDTEVARIAEQAAAVFEAWRDFGRENRAAALDAVADSLDAHKDELTALADGETALGATRLGGEVGRTTGQLRLFAELLREGDYQDIVIEPADAARAIPDLRRINRPLGPVAVFAASNFPFAFSVAGGDTASALAAGCPVVVKAHEGHPRTSLRTAQLVAAALAGAGAPEGVFAIVFGFEAGVALINHPAIAAAGFTGSARGGLALAKACAERPHPIPFYGELGSVNPVFVLPGAAARQPEEIARGYAGSLTMGVGQFCTNPGLMFVPGDTLKEEIGAAVAETSGGPMLAGRMHDSLRAAAAELDRHEGVTILASGKQADGPWSADPVVYEVDLPTFAADAEFLREERFGPVGLVIDYPGDASQGAHALLDLIDQGALGTGHLTATIHLDPQDPADVELAGRLAKRLQQLVGRIVFNGWPTGVAVNRAQHHGGPYPATTSPAYTSVGAAAIRRWLAPVVYQNCPPALLPAELRTDAES